MYLVYTDGKKPAKPPFRITLSDGTSRTDPSSFTKEELIDAGYKIAPPKPSIVPLGTTIDWDVKNERWISVGTYQKPIDMTDWYFVNKETLDILLEKSKFHKMRLIESDAAITEIDAYIDALNSVDLFQNPTDIAWPEYNPSV
jgi:hypothetical protein